MIKRDSLTIKDVAHIADVSPATISLVLNNRPGVSEKTRSRILKIIEAVNFTPNLIARSLVKNRSFAIAMLITSPLNPIFPELAAGVDMVIREHGYSLSVISTYDEGDIEANEVAKIRARGFDGIITCAALLESGNIRRLAESGYPVVSVLRRIYDCEALDVVYVKNFEGGYLGMEHLIRLGHKRIGIIKGPQNTSTGKERFEGALGAIKNYGLSVETDLVQQGDYFRPSGYIATQQFTKMGRSRRPTAIFAGNDEMALGAFEAIYDAGLRIPEDIALVGFNNVTATALRRIEITTISQRMQEMGKLAAERLIDRIEKRRGYKKPYHKFLEPELIIRKSCGFSVTEKYQIRLKRN